MRPSPLRRPATWAAWPARVGQLARPDLDHYRWLLPAVVAFGLIYGITARIGLEHSTIASNVTLWWPPTGIAQFVMLRFGFRFWPGIVIGDFIGNSGTDAPAWAVLGISAGNLLETIVCTWLLRRHAGFSNDLATVRDAIALLVLGSACAALSASVGPTALAASGVIPWSLYGSVWLQWVMGDAAGVIVVAPLLLVWCRRPWRLDWAPSKVAEAAFLLALLIGASVAVFGGMGPVGQGYYPAALAIFPLVVWAALRFGQRGATAATLVVAMAAIWGTTHSHGPFVVPDNTVDSMVRWWVFASVIAVTGLVLAASRSERAFAETQLTKERDFVAAVLDTEAALVAVLDPAGRILRVNRAFEAVTEYRAADVRGQPFTRTLVAPEELHKADANDEILRLGLSNSVKFESALVKRNGERRQMSWSNATLRDTTGRASFRIVTGIDITERVEATAALRRSRRELEELVRQRTSALQRTNEELQAEVIERRRLEREIIKVSEHEQMRIGQELHDGLGQQLTAIAFLSEILAGKLQGHAPPEAADASRIERLVSEAVSQTRLLARGLFPVELEANGLMAALEQLAANVNQPPELACEFACPDAVPLEDNEVAINLYRIAQQAVANAVQHSKGTRITITLSQSAGAIHLRIDDNGCGIGLTAEPDGMGLRTMHYRARLIGAALLVESRPEGGTRIDVRLPA